MRNSMNEETLLQTLTGRLRELLPSSWGIDVAKESDGPVDATIILNGPRGVLGVLDVAVKRWTTAPTSAVTGVLGGARMRTPNPLLLMTDYTNRPLREACEELGINYIDDSGWVLIKMDDPPIYIRVEGAERPQPRLASPDRRASNLPLAPLPQVLADLLTLPGRESLLADQLMDQLAESDQMWSS